MIDIICYRKININCHGIKLYNFDMKYNATDDIMYI